MGDFEEKGSGVAWLAPGPATGMNSRMEARAVMTPAQQGIHFSPLVASAREKSIPACRCPPICYRGSHYWASLQFSANMVQLQNFSRCIKKEKWRTTCFAAQTLLVPYQLGYKLITVWIIGESVQTWGCVLMTFDQFLFRFCLLIDSWFLFSSYFWVRKLTKMLHVELYPWQLSKLSTEEWGFCLWNQDILKWKAPSIYWGRQWYWISRKSKWTLSCIFFFTFKYFTSKPTSIHRGSPWDAAESTKSKAKKANKWTFIWDVLLLHWGRLWGVVENSRISKQVNLELRNDKITWDQTACFLSKPYLCVNMADV